MIECKSGRAIFLHTEVLPKMAQTGKTAHEVVASVGPNNAVDDDARERAEAAGVRSAAFINYAGALEAYESRSDVENMATRLTREIGPDFAAADWARESGVFSTGARSYVDVAPLGSSGPEDVSVGEGPVDSWPPA